MVARISARLSLNIQENWVRTNDFTLFFKLTNTGDLRVFIVVDMTTWKGEFTMESGLFPCDEHDLVTTLLSG